MKVQTSMAETITRVLEDWAMLLVDPATGNEILESDDPRYLVRTDFRGDIVGSYYLACNKNLAEKIATNVLGLDDAPSENDCKDAARELLNVLCGNLLTESYGVYSEFELTPPVLEDFDPERAKGLFHSARAFHFLGDDEPITVTFLRKE